MATAITSFNGLPVPRSSDHKWTKQYQAFLNANDPAGYYAWLQSNKPQFLPGGSMVDDPRATGGTVPGTTPGPIGQPPPVATVPSVWAPGAAPNTSRFGTYTLDPYLLASGTGSPGTAAPVPAVPSAAPVPPASIPAGGGGVGGAPGGAGVPPVVPPAAGPPIAPPGAMRPPQGPGGMLGGNEGGARQADRGGMFGNAGSSGNSGFGNQGMFGGNGPAGNAPNAQAPDGSGYIDLGPWGSGLLSAAATAAPGWAGVGLGALQAGMRGYNLTNTNTIRGTQGIPDTDFWQAIGALAGQNGYGALNGNALIANADQFMARLAAAGLPVEHPLAETVTGQPQDYGPFGIFGSTGPAASLKGASDMLGKASRGIVTNAGSNVGYGAGNYASTTGAPSGPAVINGGPTQMHVGGGGGSGNGGGNLGHQGSGNAGLGGPGSTSNTNGPGQASNATGQIGERGIGGGTYALGGYVRGRPDSIPDNRRIAANEGEYVIRNAAAKAAGRRLLGMLNTPAGAARLRGMLG